MLLADFNSIIHKMFQGKFPPAVLACSGGLDSMVLLDLLSRAYRTDPGQPTLLACYINHGQRDDTDKDEALILSACSQFELPFEVFRLNLQRGASEETLRKARYAALKAAAERLSNKAVVFTAHHADDQLETLLLRILRGAHPATLRGMVSRSVQNDLRLVRPLLCYSKSELRKYAEKHKLQWHEDSTNLSPRYARNRIRHELIPLLEDLYPGSSTRLLTFFSELTSIQAEKPHPSSSQVRLMQTQLQSPDGLPTLAADFLSLKASLDDLLGEHSRRTTIAHWNNVKSQLRQRQSTRSGKGEPKTLQFPGGHCLCFKADRLYWKKISSNNHG